MKDEMAQSAKDLVSGIKKIFPSSRRSGSFSLGRTSSSSEFSAEALAALSHDHDSAAATAPKKKERRPSFSFSGWKERRSSLSSKKKELSTPPPETLPPPPQPPATAPITAASRSSRSSRNSSSSHTTAARGLGQYEHSVTIATPKGDSAYLQPSGFTTTPTALARSTSHPGHFPATSATGRTAVAAGGSQSSVHAPTLRSAPPPLVQPALTQPVLARSSSASINQPTTPHAPPAVLKSSLKQSSDTVTGRSSRSQSIVPELPSKSQLTARASRSSYSAFSSSSRDAGADRSSRSRTGSYNPSGSMSVVPVKDEKKRRTSFSFSSSSRHAKTKSSSSASAAASTNVVDDVAMIVKKPHANTWDSDSDDDYEDTQRPTTRGLARRSVSMDFMEQNPTHLISKIWRKLPIQARLYSGRGSIDLDMQKDRNSFSRSSTAKAQAEKLGQSNYNKPPSPLPNANVFGDKHIYFDQRIAYFPSADGFVALESYDDVLVRVCSFAAHDQRRTATKVQEFLERSMAYLHGTKTKHGNVVSISNEEIRMWRRLARHDWSLEDVTCVADLPDVVRKQLELELGGGSSRHKDSRSSSAATTECDSDSDDQHRRRAARKATSGGMPEDAEDDGDDDEEDLTLPKGLNLRALLTVVNSCVNFGEYLFSFEELDELVRLEFLVEEDGWI